MADAIFLNATPFRLAVNLNSELQNHALDPILVASRKFELSGWPAPIQTYPGPGIFGGDDQNFMTVFSQGAAEPQVWTIRSTVSTTLGLFFYVMDARVTGVAVTGSTEGIKVVRASSAVAGRILRSIPSAVF